MTPSNPYAGLIERLWQMARTIQGPVEYAETAGEAAHDLSRLTRDVEEAKEALKPFANELYYWSPAAKDTAVVAGTTLTVSDIRKAGATLTRLSRPTDSGEKDGR